MSTHPAIAAAVERAMRQARLIDADMATFDSEPQTWSLRLPPIDPGRYRPGPASADGLLD